MTSSQASSRYFLKHSNSLNTSCRIRGTVQDIYPRTVSSLLPFVCSSNDYLLRVPPQHPRPDDVPQEPRKRPLKVSKRTYKSSFSLTSFSFLIVIVIGHIFVNPIPNGSSLRFDFSHGGKGSRVVISRPLSHVRPQATSKRSRTAAASVDSGLEKPRKKSIREERTKSWCVE